MHYYYYYFRFCVLQCKCFNFGTQCLKIALPSAEINCFLKTIKKCIPSSTNINICKVIQTLVVILTPFYLQCKWCLFSEGAQSKWIDCKPLPKSIIKFYQLNFFSHIILLNFCHSNSPVVISLLNFIHFH